MSECNNNCSSCGENCASRKAPQSFLAECNQFSKIGKVIAVASGKGGVGKSSITSLLAVAMAKQGKKVGILDADITGPSIPKAFGIKTKAMGCEEGIMPAQTSLGIKVMSLNMLLENEMDPVVWRGPVIGGTVKQFWTDVYWGELDYLFVDMPPGTGDVPLTVFQSIPVDGTVIVTTPQDLVAMIVGKSVNMARKMNIATLGIVENMSYLVCPDCGKKIPVFGESKAMEIADAFCIPAYASMPLDPAFVAMCDRGEVENADTSLLENIIKVL
ncbi:MAG: Mrp/NBP35 family ATP-binding protein [Clostridia bacterium]|nr:Mrp/NBP35 family ATP-binding protein [Clostridia bacterium]